MSAGATEVDLVDDATNASFALSLPQIEEEAATMSMLDDVQGTDLMAGSYKSPLHNLALPTATSCLAAWAACSCWLRNRSRRRRLLHSNVC